MSKEITIFEVKHKDTTLAEWRVKPNLGTALKASLLGLGALGIGLAAKYSVDFINDTMTPTYIINGNAPGIPEEKYEWVRPTNWNSKSSK